MFQYTVNKFTNPLWLDPHFQTLKSSFLMSLSRLTSEWTVRDHDPGQSEWLQQLSGWLPDWSQEGKQKSFYFRPYNFGNAETQMVWDGKDVNKRANKPIISLALNNVINNFKLLTQMYWTEVVLDMLIPMIPLFLKTSLKPSGKEFVWETIYLRTWEIWTDKKNKLDFQTGKYTIPCYAQSYDRYIKISRSNWHKHSIFEYIYYYIY